MTASRGTCPSAASGTFQAESSKRFRPRSIGAGNGSSASWLR